MDVQQIQDLSRAITTAVGQVNSQIGRVASELGGITNSIRDLSNKIENSKSCGTSCGTCCNGQGEGCKFKSDLILEEVSKNEPEPIESALKREWENGFTMEKVYFLGDVNPMDVYVIKEAGLFGGYIVTKRCDGTWSAKPFMSVNSDFVITAASVSELIAIIRESRKKVQDEE